MAVYGKLAPHPEETHPRVKLVNHLTLAPSDVPSVVDWAAKVKAWPVYYNLSIGTCTCAGIGHLIQAWTANAGNEVILPDADVLQMYETLSGYNPQTHANDNGCVEQNVLQWMSDTGIDSHKIVAFAEVNIKDPAEMKAALYQFGGLYMGIQCPKSAEDALATGQPWDYVPGSPIEGGHCIVAVKWDEQGIWIVSWGKLILMTWEFWANYAEECWVIITQDWIEANGMTPVGLNLQGLLSEFHAITGAPVPSPRHAAPKPGFFRMIWSWLRRLL